MKYRKSGINPQVNDIGKIKFLQWMDYEAQIGFK